MRNLDKLMRTLRFILAAFVFMAMATAVRSAIPETRALLAGLSAEIERAKTDAPALLEIRNRVEPVLIDLKTALREGDGQRAAAQQRLDRLGPKPAAEQPPEPQAVAAERVAAQQVLSAAENDYRQTQLAFSEADGIWNRVTDIRRELFAQRIFVRSISPLSPSFWHDLLSEGLPRMGEKIAALKTEWRAHLANPNGPLGLLLLLVIAIGLIGCVIAIPMAARGVLARFETTTGAHATRAVIARRALINLVAAVLPLPVALEVFEAANAALDTAPDSIDRLIHALALVSAGVLAGGAVMRALFSPRDRRFRIVVASDAAARRIVRTSVLVAGFYGFGIVLTEFAQLVHGMITTIVAVTMVSVFSTCGALLAGILRRDEGASRGRPTEDTPTGILSVQLGWLRPVGLIAAAGAMVLVLVGFAPLAGFIVGRLVVTALIVALAVLLLIIIEAMVSETMTRDNPKIIGASRAIGVSPALVELVATIGSGAIRLLIVAVTLFVVLGPWHLEYGEANPFQDAFFGVNLGDVRLALGTVGFALLAFVIGMVATRIFVGWLDVQLLPRTSLDAGMRNSATTILGYGGFALSIGLTLSLLGVNPQNLAVVAGALSVGIGFGLQAIVSNFVSGLILLAERPIRVGDTVLVKGDEGKVKKISVRSTIIAGYDRADIIVPNTDLITSVVRNRTFGDRSRQIKFSLLLDHRADPVEAHDICLRSIYQHANILKDPMPKVVLVKVSEPGIEMEVKGVVGDLDTLENTRSDLLFEVLEQFKAHKIMLARGAGAAEPPSA